MYTTGLDKGYLKALKMGKDEVQRLEKLGRYPYLADLDAVKRNTKIISQSNLGLVDVPLRQIHGTYTKMRGNSFSKSFYPLLSPSTEFADKWENVYRIQQNEGLRDAIKAYEYMNRIYVIEGNKRVSVLKYCDIFSFPANVTRLLPRKDPDDIKSLVYYACLEFYKLAGYNAVWFSRPDKYSKLVNLIDHNKEKFVADNPYKYVSVNLYEKFRELYKQFGGRDLPITTADAFLYFITINGFDEPTHTDKYKTMVKRYIHTLAGVNGSNIDDYVKIDSKVTNTYTTTIPRLSHAKIAFVYPDDATRGWSHDHKEAEQFIVDKYANRINVSSHANISHRSANYDEFNKIVEDNDAVFVTSPIYYKSILRASLMNKNKSLFMCSTFSRFEYVETYYGRCYEPSFILGAVAAALSSRKYLMFVAAQIVPSVLMSLNAFALGARIVNPYAQIKLIARKKPNQDLKEFEEIVHHELTHNDCDTCYNASFMLSCDSQFCGKGLYKVIRTGWEKVAYPVWRWDEFYDIIVDDILSSRFRALNSILPSRNQRLNYWWGLRTGMLDIGTTGFLPPDTAKLIKFLKNSIISKSMHPFEGPIVDLEENTRIEEGDISKLSDIIGMDWVVKGVTTNISQKDLKVHIDRYNGEIHT